MISFFNQTGRCFLLVIFFHMIIGLLVLMHPSGASEMASNIVLTTIGSVPDMTADGVSERTGIVQKQSVEHPVRPLPSSLPSQPAQSLSGMTMNAGEVTGEPAKNRDGEGSAPSLLLGQTAQAGESSGHDGATSAQAGMNSRISQQTAPHIISQLKPTYPRQSRRWGESGIVEVAVIISGNGAVENATIHKSSGYDRLDREALRVIHQWRFLPARQHNRHIAARLIVPITFDLTE